MNPHERNPVSPPLNEKSVRKLRGKQKRKKQARRACKGSALKSGMASVEKRIFLRWTGLERTEGSAHNSNIEQQNGGVKKEQVKG